MSKQFMNLLIPLIWLLGIMSICIWQHVPIFLVVMCIFYVVWVHLLFRLEEINEKLEDAHVNVHLENPMTVAGDFTINPNEIGDAVEKAQRSPSEDYDQ